MWSKLPLSSNIVTPGHSATVCRTDGHDNARYVNDRDIVVTVTHPSRPLPRSLSNKEEYGSISAFCNGRFNIFFENFSLRTFMFSFDPRDLYLTRRNPRSFSP